MTLEGSYKTLRAWRNESFCEKSGRIWRSYGENLKYEENPGKVTEIFPANSRHVSLWNKIKNPKIEPTRRKELL